MARIYVIDLQVVQVCVIHLLAEISDHTNRNIVNFSLRGIVGRCSGQSLWL